MLCTKGAPSLCTSAKMNALETTQPSRMMSAPSHGQMCIRDRVRVPADVMPESRDEYIANYLKATRGTGRLMLFACDQKIEHLNKDFYGEGIDIADAKPEHLSG